jgi:nucleoside-diphosphate-sugar epimerase
MRVFLTGGTGVLGRRLVRLLVARGHAVAALQRRPENEKTLRELGAEPRAADLYDADGLARAAEGAEVVIHAATAIPGGARQRAEDFAANDRIRTEGTRTLAQAAAKAGARRFIYQSIVWVAAPPDGSAYDEGAPVSKDPLQHGTVEGERIALEAAGLWTCVLRCGWFYAPDATHTRFMGAEIMRRRVPVIGRGDAVWAMLHVDDAASAFAAAAEGTASGLWHVVDDAPVASGDFLRAFAAQLGAKAPLRVPLLLARAFAGKFAVQFLTTSMRTSNARFKQAFPAWTPNHPTHREGLAAVVAAWKAEGYLVGGAS